MLEFLAVMVIGTLIGWGLYQLCFRRMLVTSRIELMEDCEIPKDDPLPENPIYVEEN
jgi:hypothetical protein